MKSALELLGSYQLTSGFVTGYEYPTTPVNTAGLIPGTVTTYSAEYSMYWVANLATYYQFTGDQAFVRQEWPIVQRELAWNASQVDSSGLLVTDGSDGANWHYDTQTGEQAYYNALYYRVLLDGAALAEAAGDPTAAASYTSQAAALRNAINTYLFDPATGVYNISTTQTGYVAQDANSYAVLYGIAPASTAAGILSAMEQQLSTPYGALDVSSPAPAGYNQLIGPFMGSYELWALLADHQTQAAFTLLQQEWGTMTTSDPGDTFWEAKGTDGTRNNAFASSPGGLSMAHGWAAGPTSALSEYVLGVQPVAPGYRTWLVQPQPGSLSWAEGQVPTPHGPITVKWGSQTSQGQFTIQVQPPAATTGTIDVPTSGKGAVITVSGSVVWDNGQFHAAPGITAAQLDGNYVALSANPAGAAGGSFLISSQTAS
jgi:alpha-L-rhamnosidase